MRLGHALAALLAPVALLLCPSAAHAGGPLMACCDPLGNCTLVSSGSCPFLTPPSNTCNPSPCAPPLPSVCCDPATGACSIVTGVCPGGVPMTGQTCDPNPCPAPSVCCLGSTCLISFGGNCGPFGPAIPGTCSPDPCAILTAVVCCDTAGICSIVPAGPCLSGAPLPGATTCDPNPCPQPVSCCLGGACFPSVTGSCPAGTPTPGACSPTLCPQPQIACCDPASGGCTLVTGTICLVGFPAAAQTCDPNPCPPPVVCCDPLSGACFPGTLGSCIIGNALPGGTCNPNPCPIPLFPCCNPTTGLCTMLSGAECLGTGLPGGGLTCTPNPCPQPVACCDSAGNCTLTPAFVGCLLPSLPIAGGVCSPNPCPPPIPCCTPGGGCSLGFFGVCQAPAIPATVGTTCSPDPCTPPPVALCQNVVIDARLTCTSTDVPAADINNCSTGSGITIAVSPPGPYPIGVTTVTLTVTDNVGRTSSCTATVTVNAIDVNNNWVPDACEQLWSNGSCGVVMPATTGQLSHFGGPPRGNAFAADDFALCPGQVAHVTAFRGRTITSSSAAVRKARLYLYDDCDGRPAGAPFFTSANSVVVDDQPAPPPYGPEFRVVTFGFNLTPDRLVLEGARTYWASLVGVTDGQGIDASFWVAHQTPIIGSVPVKAQLPASASWTDYTPPSGGWTPVDQCCVGCANLDFAVFGDLCECAWDNGPVLTSRVDGVPSGAPGLSPEDPQGFLGADNFVTRPCDTRALCLAEGWVWTTCVNPQPFFRLINNDCSTPTTFVNVSPSDLFIRDTGIRRSLNGQTYSLQRITAFFAPNTVLDARTYWVSFGIVGTGGASERSIFARRTPRCDQPAACADWLISQAVTKGPFPPQFDQHLWNPVGYDLAFRLAYAASPMTAVMLPDGQGAQGGPGATCRPDVNADGAADIFDIFDFLTAWFAGCP